ncbi:hypothetical protein A5731_08180 [Mycolicibacterium conceptionense]|uniref:Uncharacterized protein n=2 Tax=Mycolicibacterium conceptionense TaxID=451644 RepID=A0A0J8U4P6_9MYCO|nr:hypothetical protein ACT17_19955 [Mycolicibacterium conceptionense]OBB11437.1 hypothetical protein A5718_06555 [Mycolicibacterium conceptionense]OBF06969.1 hypothetical protein A5731_08180 [Mycolicibacterium conceptionense]OBF26614.1 hypothetical protein A5726_05445 [Mycolicibacterium conceptionense]OBF31141.1 hypothetical protein A5720_28690 [Mycolicibacterium conceptionense]
MANGLEVDTNGLRIAAATSDDTAAALTAVAGGDSCSTHSSGAGVAAVNAALASVRQRQSSRITGQANDLSVSGARYDTTDTDGSDAITTVSA